MRMGIIGGGRAAWAFGSAWRSSGGAVAGIALRDGSTSTLSTLLDAPRMTLAELVSCTDLVLLAVPDDALPSLCASVSAIAADATWLFHASGSQSSSLFAPHARAFSLHPLRSLPLPGAEGALEGALLVAEGPDTAHAIAEAIAHRAHARLARVTAAGKASYHAAAVLAANYSATLLSISERLLVGAGVEGVGADDIAALASSAVENWKRNSGTARFTGPIVRGDADVVRKHLDLLGPEPTMKSVYASLALALCEIVLEHDPDNRRVKSVQQALRAIPLP